MKKFYSFLLLLAFTAPLCSFSDVWVIGDQPVKIVKFYPNPATSYITFDFQKPVDNSFTLQVFNFMGKRLINASVATNGKMVVSLENLYRGLYIFQLRDAQGNIIESGKFQVVK